MAIIITTHLGENFIDQDAEDWDIVAPNIVDLVDAGGQKLATFFDVAAVAHLDDDDEIEPVDPDEEELPDNVFSIDSWLAQQRSAEVL